MLNTLFKLVIFIISLLALLAPFTFLPPLSNEGLDKKDKTVAEKPLHSVKLPQFSKIKDVKLKKTKFFNFLKPAIIQANQNLLSVRKKIQVIEEKLGLDETLSDDDIQFLTQKIKKYRIKGDLTYFQQVEKLLKRIDIVPTELVLVQAANESAWGTSRFARIGLNFFGLWCYQKGCGMVPNARDQDGKHEVAAFQSIDVAVEKYLYNINSHYAYVVFRTIRQQLRAQGQPLKPEILATGLLPYSERGADYVSDILDMLRHNARYIKVDK